MRWLSLFFLLLLLGCHRPYLFYDPAENYVQKRGMTVNQVIQLAKAGLDEDILIEQIQREGIRHPVTEEDIQQMRDAGLSERVIQMVKRYAPKKKRKKRRRYYYYTYTSPLEIYDIYPIWSYPYGFHSFYYHFESPSYCWGHTYPFPSHHFSIIHHR